MQSSLHDKAVTMSLLESITHPIGIEIDISWLKLVFHAVTTTLTLALTMLGCGLAYNSNEMSVFQSLRCLSFQHLFEDIEEVIIMRRN